ncbi:E3 ubiquitin ligase [Haloactinospora alba]|uniref:RING-type E3 ubiquitin transferase n=2 Tax=Haloactinospora alba TaxID=405555 RepID=A0A543N6Y4_9ACTN|nr:E3 ubiquitin ligase [Haloactinospora alba]
MDFLAENPFLFALALVVLAGVLAWFGWQHRSRRVALLDTPTLTCAQFADATAQRGAVTGELSGTAEPAPDGTLSAPFSSTPCVWHRTEVIRHYRKRENNQRNGSRTVRRRETIAKNESPEAFQLADSTGRLMFAPDGAWVDAPVKSLDRFERGTGPRSRNTSDSAMSQLATAAKDMAVSVARDGSTIGYTYREWIIRPQERIFALGAVQRNGSGLLMSRPEGAPYVLSTRSEAEITRSDLLWQRVFLGGTLACVMVAMALTAYGAFL